MSRNSRTEIYLNLEMFKLYIMLETGNEIFIKIPKRPDQINKN